ncbi:MAG TPA: HlyD family secretion protein [Bryobacteraceae bacterium]|jgi:membrane fusion protein (multidrug efflux system)
MDTLIEELEQTRPGASEVNKNATPRVRKNRRTRLLLAGGALVVLAAATATYLHFRGRVSTDDAQVDAHIAPIAPKISGSIAEILVDDNEAVKPGQVLVRIDPRDYQAKVDQARAALSAAESRAVGAREDVPLTDLTTASSTSAAEAQLAAASADYARAKADYDRASSSELAYAQADVEAKRATADRARADLARMEPLAAKDEISKLQLDSYTAGARVADSDLTASRQKLANAEKQAESSQAAMEAALAKVGAARATLEQARATRQQVKISSAQAGTAAAAILQARANLEAAELELSYATLRAPVEGVVTRKSVQLGQIVQPGQSLMTIVPLQDVWVTANFKETQLSSARPGQRAEIHVDMYGRSFAGRVDSVAGATGTRLSLLPPENATGNYVKIVQRIPVKIRLEDVPAGFTFRPGMNVDATIFTR